ncbi:MAG TPA: tRNA-binding protein [Candidatus Eremiobacteraceae bacterium]|nr:tRNA-binding protein [Candidatus Eremiobacteraceae bacterium]
MDEIVAAFAAVEIRTGTVLEAEPIAGARKPSYKLRVDFGLATGTRTSSAQLTRRYQASELIGKQVLGVVNLPVKRIAGVASEVLTLGVEDEDGAVVLIVPENRVPNGARLF